MFELAGDILAPQGRLAEPLNAVLVLTLETPGKTRSKPSVSGVEAVGKSYGNVR